MSENSQLPDGFIKFIQEEQGAIWRIIQRTNKYGELFHIDEENDAITPSNRLLLTDPSLHEVLCTIINEWAEFRLNKKNLIKNFQEGINEL